MLCFPEDRILEACVSDHQIIIYFSIYFIDPRQQNGFPVNQWATAMALAATEASLERLQQQVNNGQVGIAAACLRIENTIQTLCRDDTTRPFLSLLPRLTTLFFGGTSLEGDQNQMGWVELASDSTGMDALFTLLHPNGVLFQACLAYSCCDGIATFDMEITQLPVCSFLFRLFALMLFWLWLYYRFRCKKPFILWETKLFLHHLTQPL